MIGWERFLFVDIDRSPADPFLFQGQFEGLVIDQSTASGVDQDGVGLHLAECSGSEEVTIFRGVWCVDGDEVRGAEQSIEGEPRDLGCEFYLGL